MRAEVAPFFTRGQVDAQVRLPEEVDTSARLEVDGRAARLYADAARRLKRALDLDGALDVATLLALPGVVRQLEPEPAGDDLRSAVRAALREACSDAADMRRHEGEALERELRVRLEGIATGLAEIEMQAGEMAKGLRERLERRVAQLAPEVGVDPTRLDQEIVLAADRMDVTEETVRLRSHLTQFGKALERGGPTGRKLEFLLQEMGREVNTIGSKAQAAHISSRVVDLKTEIEKVREQVLNVE